MRSEFLVTYKNYQQDLMSHRKTPLFPAGLGGKKESELTEEEAAAWTARREEKNSTEQRSFRDAMSELLKQKVQRGEHRD